MRTNVKQPQKHLKIKGDENMSDKKMSLAEAVKQKLAQKQAGTSQKAKEKGVVKTAKPLKNQLTKKPNNQRKRTGV